MSVSPHGMSPIEEERDEESGSHTMTKLADLRWPLHLLLAIALSACAGTSGDSAGYDPLRCDRNGDESQRRAC